MKKLLYFFCLLISVSVLSTFSVGQSAIKKNLVYADSLFLARDFKQSGEIFKSLISDTSHDAFHLNRLGYTELMSKNYNDAEKYLNRALASHPSLPLKASILSRLARVSAKQNDASKAVVLLDSAVADGYLSYPELDTLEDFSKIRNNAAFLEVRNRLYNSIYPCYQDQHAHEFDFWIGEWDVYVTGTISFAGKSVIQRISGGCAILENWQSAISEGKSLNFIDDNTHKWKQVWVGSYPNGKQDFVNGEYKDSVMRFTFTTLDAQGHIMQGKFSFFNQGPNQVRQLNETSSDDGKTWTVSYDFTYKRKKS
jgi:tetratricopeptide (TPR) repeat protein